MFFNISYLNFNIFCINTALWFNYNMLFFMIISCHSL